ncbi:MAG: ROK family transcriptional regulator [Nocardioides sp.]
MRRHNTARVLRTLRRNGPGTRADLAKRTDLAKATIGAIVSDLRSLDVVAEGPARNDGRGRPGRPVRLTGARYLGLGFELNVDYVTAVAVDLSGEIRWSEVHSVSHLPSIDHPGHPLLELVAHASRSLAGFDLLGATVAVPGLVWGDKRTLAWSPHLQVQGTALADRVEEVLGGRTPVRVDNDANCAALAEAHRGAAQGFMDSLYITGTVGIGAGMIQAGRLYRGARGFAGEIGHLPLGEPTARCRCGQFGCWEASVGLHAVLDKLGLPEVDNPVASAEYMASRATLDSAISAKLADTGRTLGAGLAVLAGICDPAIIVLGGYFGPLAAFMIKPARLTLAERIRNVRVPPDVRVSSLGIRAAGLGAAEESVRPVFTGEATLS